MDFKSEREESINFVRVRFLLRFFVLGLVIIHSSGLLYGQSLC